MKEQNESQTDYSRASKFGTDLAKTHLQSIATVHATATPSPHSVYQVVAVLSIIILILPLTIHMNA